MESYIFTCHVSLLCNLIDIGILGLIIARTPNHIEIRK